MELLILLAEARNNQTMGRMMLAFIKRFMDDQSGASAIEYALIAAGISVAIVAVVQKVGGSLVGTFNSVANALTGG